MLECAICCRHVEVVDFLLRAGAVGADNQRLIFISSIHSALAPVIDMVVCSLVLVDYC